MKNNRKNTKIVGEIVSTSILLGKRVNGSQLSTFYNKISFLVDDMEQYLHYIGGGAGALALTGVAAASAFYLASRPSPQKPLFPLDGQCVLEKEHPDVRTVINRLIRQFN